MADIEALIKKFIKEFVYLCYDRGEKSFFINKEVRVVRKWLMWLTAIVGSILITSAFHTPLLELFSLSQVNLLKLSMTTCDSLATSDIDESCLSLEEFPQSLHAAETYNLIVNDPKGNNVTEGLTFTSSLPEVASVSHSGQVKALSAGVSTITIEHTSGFRASFELTVEPQIPVIIEEVRISLLNTRKTITQGERFSINVKITPSDSSSSVSFSSSDPTIATIDKEGLIVALLPGKVTIKATVNEKSASFVLEVLKKNELIKLQSMSIVSASTTMEISTTQLLSIKKTPADANEAIKFDCSDSSVLTVSASGKVTANAVGLATVTVRNSSNTITASVTIRVVNSLDIDRLIRDVFKLTNQERVNAGLQALTYNNVLENGAMIRAEEIIQSFSHTRPDGSKFFTVFDDTYAFQSMGENLAAGFTSASSVVDGWMNSEGHRANILKEGYTQIGIGIKKDKDGRVYWVQIFANPK
jgi:uncharacterized protein YkwD